MRSRPQEPPYDVSQDLLEWALTIVIVTVVLSLCWLASGWIS